MEDRGGHGGFEPGKITENNGPRIPQGGHLDGSGDMRKDWLSQVHVRDQLRGPSDKKEPKELQVMKVAWIVNWKAEWTLDPMLG